MHRLTSEQVETLRDITYNLTQVERIPEAEHELVMLQVWISKFEAPETYGGRTAALFRRLVRREARAYVRHHSEGIHPYARYRFETWDYDKHPRHWKRLAPLYTAVWQQVQAQYHGQIGEGINWTNDASKLWWFVQGSEVLLPILIRMCEATSL